MSDVSVSVFEGKKEVTVEVTAQKRRDEYENMSEGSDSETGGDDQMEEIKTGITFENEWNQSRIHIDVPVPYEEGLPDEDA